MGANSNGKGDSGSAVKAAQPAKSGKKFLVYLKRYWQLYLLLFLPLGYLILFRYVPMAYVQIAFKEYKITESVWKMPFSDPLFKYFTKAFSDRNFLFSLRNTLLLNLLDLAVGFPIPIMFAVMLNELKFPIFKKVVQTVAYMPHFLSWVIISSLALQLLATDSGMVNMFLKKINLSTIPFLEDNTKWVITYILVGVWQSFGWNSIVYLAAITGINPELYEAAAVDGAGRWRKIWHITLPGLRPTIVILLIMAIGNILGSSFDRPYAMQNKLVLEVGNVISTYVYTNGIKGLKFSLTTAVGLFQSVVGVVFLLLANFISRKLGDRGIW